MLSLVTANPILAITQQEASILAQASGKVARHYPMKASAETLDWVGLLMALITVYGTRALALRARKPEETPVRPQWEPQIIAGSP